MRPPPSVPQLVCPAGSLRALQLAVDAGADAVYLGLRDATNARNFGGLNFDVDQVREGLRYAHARGVQVLMALNTYPRADDAAPWRRAVDLADALGIDALIIADIGLLGYAARSHPDRALHLSVQASATTAEALAYYRRRYRIRRAVLPRVLTLQQVQRLCTATEVEIEVFGFGSLCVMVEGRCALSSWVTGRSPNTHGVCSPAESVRWEEQGDHVLSRLEGVLIDDYGPGEPRGYPTLCKGRFVVDGERDYAMEEPTSLNTVALLPGLIDAGVRAIKIEGRQRSPAYVADVTRVWREAIDLACSGQRFHVQPAWLRRLAPWTEGSQTTLGAFDRPWR
ncbi:MAG: U32 family peptidase [Burkholderiales bacterium]|nr:U32 family peptidase [Burkholderiales bacterium]